MEATIEQLAIFDDPDAPDSASAKARKRHDRKMARTAKQQSRSPKPIEPRSAKQRAYIESLIENELTFGIGPAGVGKTYVPARVYGHMISTGQIAKLYLARPNIAKAKHRNGFLPGTEAEKTAPWLVPIMEGLRDSMGKAQLDTLQKAGAIEIVPYEFIQGRTFAHEKGAACIVDEAENLDLDDLYITLTRQGDNLRMVLSGDIYQSRIPDSGLARVVEMTFDNGIEGVGVVQFDEDDVVRSRQAAQWVRAFRLERQSTSARGSDTTRAFQPHTTPAFLKGGI